ncbi:alkaline shock response membrane anchor protein AmaP [Streptomyces sp. NEAU-S7GS2]|uniref:alkaline shock response membrane anchor protein AmaP n=1 Tax=Streptomyces sp. NEAU-S7GS2 TaxID=2202000 RepID=UPI000D6F87B6|nr:alkaline shock response membrane anchor protein AmaP [Streptomyces sp. NEAU-S7GS2]AWN30638.1 alkaline shock response membrane anchor protein AmaP [Streptomyces sp. NEAU-S7GS2]
MREHAKTNRTLLALLGLVLLGGGLLVLAGGADIYRRFHLMPPASWPLTASHNVLVPSADQTRWTGMSWWWPATTAALALLMLLALAWLLSQHRRHPRQLTVADSSKETVTVSNHALSDALTTDLNMLPGVRGSHALFYGKHTPPQARIGLTLGPGTSPEQILEGLHDAVERARRSAGWDNLPTRVDLSVARHSPHRVE